MRGSTVLPLRHVVLALIGGVVVMVLEILAPRFVAPTVGTGAPAWTASIVTFLGGLAMGSAAGGWLADRVQRGLLPALFVLGATATALTVPLVGAAAAATAGIAPGPRPFLLVPLAFLPAAFLAGTIPPVLARAGLAAGARRGRWLGTIAAAGALGSVGGALLAAWEAIPEWGLSRTAIAGAGLLAAGATLAPWSLPACPRIPGSAPRPPVAFLALAFVAGAALLAVEVLAGRLASDAFGASLYTWTSVIGVVLAGLTVGAMGGGTLADRLPPRPLLFGLLVGSSVATLGLLWAPAILSSAARWSEGGSISWPAATLGGSAVAFLPVSALLGAIPPVLVRAALGAPAAHGRVVGWFYAIGTVGAVAGAVLAAAALIPLAGLERTILFVAFALACCCAYVWRRKSYAVYALYALILAPAVLLHGPWEEGRALARRLALPVDEDVLHVEDSRYSRIRVQSMSEVDQEFRTAVPGTLGTIEVAGDPVLHLQGFYDEERGLLHWRGAMRIEQRDRLVALGGNADAVDRLYDRVLHARQLRLDRLVHGGVDPTDPTWLWYGYERLQATLLAHLWPDEGPVRCFFIGGGAYAFPRFLLATRGEGLRITTAEIDPRVTAVARTWLGLAEDPRHRILDEDARTALRGRAGAHDFDFVFGDAFDHIAVPFHLTTIEFDREVKARLKPGGIYMVNVIDSMDSGLFLGAMLHTLGFVFDRVYLVSEEPRTSVGRYAWLVVATDRDLGLEGRVLDSARGGRARVADTATVAAVVRRAKRRVLTDDDAPVEKLLAPVVYASPRR